MSGVDPEKPDAPAFRMFWRKHSVAYAQKRLRRPNPAMTITGYPKSWAWWFCLQSFRARATQEPQP